MRVHILIFCTFTFALSMLGQTIPVTFTINTEKDTLSISPYIYGTNGQSDDRDLNITARRLGGNRLTGYNWENNASNMGMDYDQSNSNDNYLTWSAGISGARENIPGIVLTAFHDTSLAMSCYSLLTLPAAGYVSRDKDGSVESAQTAPSSRFRQVKNTKGSALALAPDTADNFVYVDEEVNFLTHRYGASSSPMGVHGYEADNEPALWPSTHPRIHPAQTTCREVIGKNVALAKAIKAVDPTCEVFGGVFYGFSEYYDMQNAPDKSAYALSNSRRFVDAFLANVRDSSTAAGKRLVDVLDLHLVPDLNTPITQNENADSATVVARVQAPRSLWDSSYVESGWIGQWYSPIALVPRIQLSIKNNNPGTKLAFTEFNYGGASHISGAIALCDVLGIFGKYGVYFATHWGAVDGYLASAYKMYRNYDDTRSAFGDLSVSARTSDAPNSSVYAALHTGDPATLDMIVINRNLSRSIQGNFTVQSPQEYLSTKTFALTSAASAIQTLSAGITVSGNTFAYSIPPLSVYHFVLSATGTRVAATPIQPKIFSLSQNYPNPFNPTTVIAYRLPASGRVTLKVYDVLGKAVAALVDEQRSAGTYEITWNAQNMPSGIYYYRLNADGFTQTRAMVLLK